MAYRIMESLAKDPLNSKAVNGMGWSKKQKWRSTLGLAEDWQKQQKGINLVKLKNTMASLKKSLVGARGKPEEILGEDFSEFTRFACMPEHLCILGNDSKVLGYRVGYGHRFLGELAISSAQLPPLPLTSTKRGDFEE
jgi:hypothetical protein